MKKLKRKSAYEVIQIGYTHYWRLKAKPEKEDLTSVLPYIEKLLEPYQKLIQYEDDIEKPPVISKKLIRFNGMGGLAHDTFYFQFPTPAKFEKDYGFGSCKTACKPYDIVVCKTLIALKGYLQDDMLLYSDGFSNDTKSFDVMWQQAIDEMKVVGYEITTQIVPRDGTPFYDCEICSVALPR